MAGDQQALGTFVRFHWMRDRFISLCRGPEELILPFLCRLFVGQVVPNWISRPTPSFLKIYLGSIQVTSFIRAPSFLPHPAMQETPLWCLVQCLLSRSVGCAVQCSLLLMLHHTEKMNGGICSSLTVLFFIHLAKISFSVPQSYQESCSILSAGYVLTATVEMTAPASPPL